MGDRMLLFGVEADRQGAAEPDRGEGDVARRDVWGDRVVASGKLDQSVEQGLGGGAAVGPVRCVELRVDDVDHSQAGVDGGVHVAAQRLAAGG